MVWCGVDMVITKEVVKELREMTGAGLMDCKRALCATNGNFDDAVKWLKEHSGAIVLKTFR